MYNKYIEKKEGRFLFWKMKREAKTEIGQVEYHMSGQCYDQSNVIGSTRSGKMIWLVAF
jgi:hypothetical protein